MTDLLALLLALGGGAESGSSAQGLAQELTHWSGSASEQLSDPSSEEERNPGQTVSQTESAEPNPKAESAESQTGAESLSKTLSALEQVGRSAQQMEETALSQRTAHAVETAVNTWLTAVQNGTGEIGTVSWGFSPGVVQNGFAGGTGSAATAPAVSERISGFQQSAGAPPLERVAIQETGGSQGLSLSALDRIMERDARRYDNGFPLY